jgi:[ribosomal protein S18]-alanine N-acetyltransferase
MWVESEFRGKGVGARLLDTVIEWANSKGARAMELRVSENQRAAIRLYESKGFSDTGEVGLLRPGSTIHARKMVREK